MTAPHWDIYGEDDLNVFKGLAALVVQERTTGRKPTIEQILGVGQLQHFYESETILNIVGTLASGAQDEAYKIEALGTVEELRERGEI